MKVIVFAHRLEVGGSQLNAINLAAGLRDRHGFDVILFATPGRPVRAFEERGPRYVPASDARLHPSLARMRALPTAPGLDAGRRPSHHRDPPARTPLPDAVARPQAGGCGGIVGDLSAKETT
jgi:hypothetical protein